MTWAAGPLAVHRVDVGCSTPERVVRREKAVRDVDVDTPCPDPHVVLQIQPQTKTSPGRIRFQRVPADPGLCRGGRGVACRKNSRRACGTQQCRSDQKIRLGLVPAALCWDAAQRCEMPPGSSHGRGCVLVLSERQVVQARSISTLRRNRDPGADEYGRGRRTGGTEVACGR